MKKIYYLFALLLLSVFSAKAVTTITTPVYPLSTAGYSYYYFQSSPIAPCAITFVVNNTNSYPITIQKVGYSSYNSDAHSLYYSASSLTGACGNIPSSSSWIQAANLPTATYYFPTIAPDFFSCCVTIPANTQYRFAVVSATSVLFGSNVLPAPNAFGSSGVYLDCSNCYYGAASICASTGYGYFGSITFSTCEAPGILPASGVTSSAANFSWSPVAGATGYEYAIDQSPTYTSGTLTPTVGTTYNATGLNSSTAYYLHVRNVCSSTDKSCFVDIPATTLPPCTMPVNFSLTSLSPTSADFSWDPVVTAISYNYMVDQQTGTPSVTGSTNTLNNTGSVTGLTEGTTYYVHIRTNCDNQETDWSLDSFTTPIPCRAPVIRTDYINTDQAVAYWDAVPTATAYEYAVTKSSTPPALGTKIESRSILMSALLDGVTYYVHVRSMCMSQGIEGLSPWATTTFKTFPLSVNAINNEGLSLEVYPNPAQNVLNVKLMGTLQHNAVINLTDISGRVLKQMTLNRNEMTMDISSIAPGIYQLQYKDDVNSKVIKVVKQ